MTRGAVLTAPLAILMENPAVNNDCNQYTLHSEKDLDLYSCNIRIWVISFSEYSDPIAVFTSAVTIFFMSMLLYQEMWMQIIVYYVQIVVFLIV
jgi:hypothetical protein